MNSLNQHKTAILLFANSPKLDAERKSIYKGELLFDGLTSHTLKKVRRTQLPFFHFTENDQVGDDFGERLANAMSVVYAKGFTNVIVIGNDAPLLNERHLTKAREQSERGNFVVGPSTDGGVYLLALNKSIFDRLPIKGFHWQSESLALGVYIFAALKGVLVSQLPILSDIDCGKDIKQVMDSHKLSPELLQLFLAIYVGNSKEETLYINYYDLKPLKSIKNKGSPTFFLS